MDQHPLANKYDIVMSTIVIFHTIWITISVAGMPVPQGMRGLLICYRDLQTFFRISDLKKTTDMCVDWGWNGPAAPFTGYPEISNKFFVVFTQELVTEIRCANDTGNRFCDRIA